MLYEDWSLYTEEQRKEVSALQPLGRVLGRAYRVNHGLFALPFDLPPRNDLEVSGGSVDGTSGGGWSDHQYGGRGMTRAPLPGASALVHLHGAKLMLQKVCLSALAVGDSDEVPVGGSATAG